MSSFLNEMNKRSGMMSWGFVKPIVPDEGHRQTAINTLVLATGVSPTRAVEILDAAEWNINAAIASRKEPDMDERIFEAAAAWNYVWPEQLTSGVMFYKGLRITRTQFSAVAKGPFGPATPENIDSATFEVRPK